MKIPNIIQEITELQEDRLEQIEFMQKLVDTMKDHPDLPVEWVKPVEDGAYSWAGGYEFCNYSVPNVEVGRIARGYRSHAVIEGRAEPAPMDSCHHELEWYDAIIVTMW